MMEPISIIDVEDQTRTTLADEVSAVNRFIAAVRQKGEAVTRRALVEKQLTLTLDAFPSGRNPIVIPNPPLKSINTIKYIDLNGVEQTLDPLAYRVVFSTTEPQMYSYVIPLYGLNWPTALQDLAVVNINYTCGYTPENCPDAIKQWMLLNVGSLYENREETIVGNRIDSVELKTLADSLIENYRIPRL